MLLLLSPAAAAAVWLLHQLLYPNPNPNPNHAACSLLHRLLDRAHQLPCPYDAARSLRQVARPLGRVLVLLVHPLHPVNVHCGRGRQGRRVPPE